MQARYYDPVIGRFLSIDPVTFLDTGEPAMFNRFAYTFNDPINLTDPDGRLPIICALCGIVNSGIQNGRTIAVGVEVDIVLGETDASGGAKGVFISQEPLGKGGGVTFGTFKSTKEGLGVDGDGSLMLSITGGGSETFEGKSTTVEGDAPTFGTNGAARAGVTLEGGVTESGAPVGGIELAVGGLPVGGALYKTETTITNSVTLGSVNVDITEDVEENN